MTTRTVLVLVSALVLPSASEGSVDLVVRANPMSETAPVEPRGYGVSCDGRFVVYLSKARNILPAPQSTQFVNAYLYDRSTRKTTLVSHGSGPMEPGDQDTLKAQISCDGSVIALESRARNLVPGRSGGLFLFETATGTVSFAGTALSPVAFSSNGAFVAFRSIERGHPQIVLLDRSTQTRTLVSHREGEAEPSNGPSEPPVMSADGRFIAYTSTGTNIVAGTPPGANLFLFDRSTGLNVLVARSSTGPVMSGDGRWIAFSSDAPDLFPGQVDANGISDAFLFDRVQGGMTLLSKAGSSSVTGNGRSLAEAISDDGGSVLISSEAANLVVMTDDPGQKPDLFLHRRQTGSLELLSHPPGRLTEAAGVSGAGPPYGSLSRDGSLAGFASAGRLWVYDAGRQDVRSIGHSGFEETQASGVGLGPVVVSGNGQGAVFASAAVNLGVGIRDFDIDFTLYGWEASSAAVEPASRVGSPSVAALIDEFSVSRSGRFVAFTTRAPNALTDPIAPVGPIAPSMAALLDRVTGRSQLASWAGSRSIPMTAEVWSPRVSGDGSAVFFQADDAVFCFRRDSGELLVVSHTNRLDIPTTGLLGSVSDDGSYAVFDSTAPDLGADIPPNGFRQVYLWSRSDESIRLISRSASGGAAGNGVAESGPISADGSTIAFMSRATDLLGATAHPAFIFGQLYLYERVTRSLRLVSRSGAGTPVQGVGLVETARRAFSDDGRFLLFGCSGTDVGGIQTPGGIVNLYIFDRDTNAIELVSHAPGRALEAAVSHCIGGELSRDGRRATFHSGARNLASTTGNVQDQLYVFDRASSEVRCVSRTLDGSPASFPVDGRLSPDGSTVAFSTQAPGLLPFEGDGDRVQAFAFDVSTGRLSLASHSGWSGRAGNGSSFRVAMDEHGDEVFFLSGATDLGSGLQATDLVASSKIVWSRFGLFAFRPPPFVLGPSPACASTSGGRSVRIHGGHFQAGATVTLDGIAAQVASVSSTEIVATAGARAPGPAHTGHIVVTNPNGEYFALGNAFTYAVRGDANNSGALTAADGFFLRQAVFLGGPQPASLCNGDANGSGAITSADSFFLNLYLFLGGAPPPP